MTTQPRISASRVPMLLNESRWGTRLSLYHELRGEGPPRETNEVLEEGIAFEPVILRQGAKKHRMQLVEGPKELIHGDLIGHPDGYVIDEHGKLAVAESKNLLFADVGEEAGWGEAETDRVPMAYFLQCQTYGHLLRRLAVEVEAVGGCLVLNAAGAIVIRTGPPGEGQRKLEVGGTVYLFARLWHGTRRYCIKVDPAICAKIESEASAFLDRVARGEPPDPTTLLEFNRRWTPVPEKATEFSEADFAVLKSLLALQQQIKAAEAEETKLKLYLAGRMQDNAIGTYRGKKVLSYTADRKFDEAAFAQANPELWGGPAYRSFDPSILRHENPALYEQFLRHPPAEQQTRKLRPSKAIEGM